MSLKNSASTGTSQLMDVFDTRYLRTNKLLLSLLGLWPMESSFNRNIFYYCALLDIILIIQLPQFAFLFTRMRDLNDLYDSLPTFLGVHIVIFKLIGLRWQTEKIKMVVQHVRQDWCSLMKHSDISILMEYSEKSRLFTLAYIIFTSISVTSFVTAPITIRLFDIILGSNVTRPKRLPHPSEFFLDLEKYYYIVLTIMFVGYIATVTVVIATDTVYFALMQHICGILAILSYRLKNLTIHDKSQYMDHNPVSKRGTDVENIVQCIQLQVRTERLIQLIESTFAICFFSDIGLGIPFYCSACVMIVQHTEVMKNCMIALIQATRFFFNSWIGQSLIDHSSQIFIAAYNGMWYQMSLEAKKILLFLIMKCQKPCYMTVAKLYIICMESYSTLMRTTVSYVMLMSSLNSDDM